MEHTLSLDSIKAKLHIHHFRLSMIHLLSCKFQELKWIMYRYVLFLAPSRSPRSHYLCLSVTKCYQGLSIFISISLRSLEGLRYVSGLFRLSALLRRKDGAENTSSC